MLIQLDASMKLLSILLKLVRYNLIFARISFHACPDGTSKIVFTPVKQVFSHILP
jgi:hypothetical protein